MMTGKCDVEAQNIAIAQCPNIANERNTNTVTCKPFFIYSTCI